MHLGRSPALSFLRAGVSPSYNDCPLDLVSHSRDSQERALESPTPPPSGGWDIPGQEQTGPRGSSAIKFRMWPQAQAWSCGDRRPLPVLTAQPRGGLWRLQVAYHKRKIKSLRGWGRWIAFLGTHPAPCTPALEKR